LIGWWNLYGLPVLLVVVALALLIRRRTRPAGDDAQQTSPVLLTVRAISLVHVVIALRAGLSLVQELLTLRAQGIPQSFPITGIVIPAITMIVGLAIGHGLWHVRPWGRRAAIGWSALMAIVTGLVALWQWRFHAAVTLEQWPDYVVADALPWFLLAVMLLPAIRWLFQLPRARSAGVRDVAGPPWPLIEGLCVLLLLVAVSTLLVDATDWLVRALTEAA
jgi:hypothetical protein